MTVSPLRGRAKNKTVRLPADYIAAHTTLGYACTIDSAQGVTAGGRDIDGTCHIVGSDRLTRQQLYVAGTRGKNGNHIYFSTAESDPHRVLAPKATHPPTAVDILSQILRRDGAQVSAHSAAAAESDPFTRLHAAAAMYSDALTAAAEHTAGAATMAHIDAAAAAIRANITDYAAWPVLRRNLALLAVDGHDPIEALHAAAATPLGNPIDVAAVLDWRLQPPQGSTAERVGPLRWLAAIPDALAAHPQWGPYLHARSQLVGDLADQIRAAARQWQPGTVPAWARPLLAEQPQLMAEIAVFRAAHDVDVADTRITGPEQHANRSAAIQQLIHGRVDAALRRGQPGAQRWRSLAETVDAHITADPFWPRLATHLDAAARAGADVVRTAHRRDRPPRAAARRAARRSTVVAAGRHPGTAHPRRRQHRAAPGLDTRTAPPARLAHRRNRHRRPGVAIAGHRRRRLRLGTTRPAHRRRRTPARHRRNRAPAARRIRPPAAPTGSNCSPTTPPPSTPTSPTPPRPPSGPPPPSPASGSTCSTTSKPPPDPDDYPYSYAEDTLDGLDFTDLPRHRPTPRPPSVDADIAALRAQRAAAHQHAAQLAQAILRCHGPAEVAAAAELAELHERHQQQRHHQHDLAHAHGDWVSAEHTAEIHRALLDRLATQINAAQRRR